MTLPVGAKEKPILFSVAMVNAILAGRKTQTRRIVKVPSWSHDDYMPPRLYPNIDGLHMVCDDTRCLAPVPCPYGKPGDRLWVKEAYYAWGKWVRNGLTKSGRQAWKFVQVGTSVRYMDGSKPSKTAKRDGETGWVYRHGRFMPKKHSRITLEISEVRVQRLQEISEKDAIAEGIRWDLNADPYAGFGPNACKYRSVVNANKSFNTAMGAFRELWESINGADSWNLNPWVWAISFRQVQL